MDNETKFVALEKLKSVTAHIGYPDEFDIDGKINETYKNVTLYPLSFLRSEMSLKQFYKNNNYASLRKLVKKNDWISDANLVTADATYTQDKNEIEIPAGILQGYFYNSDRPNYMNYAAIGWVIGHEFSHAFDDLGSQYDEKGNLFDWWKNSTREEYLKKAKCLIEQYGNYTVKRVNLTLDGFQTQDENIADNIGLKAAYLAYDEWTRIHGKESQLPGLNYTSQQMFWISAATSYCEKAGSDYLKLSIRSNEHVPGEFRVIGTMSNMPEFAKDFQCPLGSPMNPVKKCSVW